MVEKAHTDTERRKSLEVRDENDSRNRVMQKQAELKASGSEQETSEDIKDVPSKSAEDNLSSDAKFTLTSENSKPDDKRLRGRTPVFASVDESGLLPDEDLSDPPPQIFDVDVDSVEDESEYGVDGIDSEFKINESVSHRVKKKKRR
jgi:hypothetical protein